MHKVVELKFCLNSNSFVLFELVCFSKKEKERKIRAQERNPVNPKPQPGPAQTALENPTQIPQTGPFLSLKPVGRPTLCLPSFLLSRPSSRERKAQHAAQLLTIPQTSLSYARVAFPLALTKLARASVSPRACPRYALRRFLRLTRRSHSSAASSTRTPVPRFARYLPPLSRVTRTLRPRPTGPTCRRRSFRRLRPLLSRCPAWPTCRLRRPRRDARAEQTRRDLRAAPTSLARTPRSAAL